MCGFVGFIQNKPDEESFTRDVLTRMNNTLHHRGPDDEGIWIDDAGTFALAHRRLSVLDLSSAGHQPMKSASGRFVIAYNGEVYNFRLLRDELTSLGCGFRSDTDTEVILVAIEQWGVQETLQRIRGMFAFSIWDDVEKKLYLVKDRMGEKPLYYGEVNGVFFFGSEVRAFRSHPKWSGEIDREALSLYVQFNCVPTPFSIYKGIRKLRPGCYLEVSSTNRGVSIRENSYWDVKQVACNQPRDRSIVVSSEIGHLDTLIASSVREKMVADVPLGAFLSGGVDSSLVVAQMQAASRKPINTFTIGFHEQSHNEANYAKRVARYLGTAHTELYLSGDDTLAVVDKLPTIYDEPFADFSQLPTFLVSQLARQSVTVALSGDGGDELFGGYSRYQLVMNTWTRLNRLPLPVRRLLSYSVTALPDRFLDSLFAFTVQWFAKYGKRGRVSDKLNKSAELMAAESWKHYYQKLMSVYREPSQLVVGGQSDPGFLYREMGDSNLSLFESMMLVDQQNYLPDDILVKMDRVAMHESLETRTPLLDHRIVEYAWTIPEQFKYRNGEAKWLLKQVLYRHLPAELVDRPKMGFSVPVGAWLRGPLRKWAEALLDENRLRQEGFFHPAPIRQKWQEHLSGRRNWQYHLWNILMFQVWYEANNTP